MTSTNTKRLEQLFTTITASTSPFHTAAEVMHQLIEHGFTKLAWDTDWTLQKGGSYFVCPYGTTVFAFTISKQCDNPIIKAASSHIDNPGFRIKYHADITSKNGYRLNTELYGGAIYSTWLDRPLSLAGRIALKSTDAFHPHMELLDFHRSIGIIPNLAIHLNRKVNDGIALNPQNDLLPLCAAPTPSSDEKELQDYLFTQIANELNVNRDDILSCELSAYNPAKPEIIGFAEDLFAAPRIDNLSSVSACITGLTTAAPCDNTIRIVSFYDHEEIGSTSKNGAKSHLFTLLIERIYQNLGISNESYVKNLTNDYYLSLDVAHATHPNHPEKSDTTAGITLNSGFAIKCSAKQSYCTDDATLAVLLNLAAQSGIACQPNQMRSDIPGGSTLGPYVTTDFPVNSADIGIPILAMHSSLETAGVYDQIALEDFMNVYFS